MKTALVHDWLVSPVGGGENVLKQMHALFPSPIYTLLKNEQKLKNSYFDGLEIFTSFIQKFPFAAQKYRSYLPLFPFAIEQFNLAPYDLILSSSHCVAKGVICHPDQLHICYCHTPVRYAWDLMHEYLAASGLDRGPKGMLARLFLHYLRGWDSHSAHRVDAFIANSRYVARRIQKCYGRKAEVIYPPVDTSYFIPDGLKEDFYLAYSRFVPYKRIDLIVEAFSQMPDKKLVVIGSGPEEKKIVAKAKKNIEFLGFQPNAVLREYLQKAKGFVFAAVEDFGIAPVEAMSCGTPVIGYGKGGLLETVVSGKTGLFFAEQTTGAIRQAVEAFERLEWDPLAISQHAEKFKSERFSREFYEFVVSRYASFQATK